MTKTIDMEIYGQRYSICGEADDVYIRRLASFVDEHMRTLAEGMKTATPSKRAVLTARFFYGPTKLCQLAEEQIPVVALNLDLAVFDGAARPAAGF